MLNHIAHLGTPWSTLNSMWKGLGALGAAWMLRKLRHVWICSREKCALAKTVNTVLNHPNKGDTLWALWEIIL
jgi:hypothetical protein